MAELTPKLDPTHPTGLDYYDSTGAYVGTWGPGSPPGVSLVRGGKIRAVTVDRTGRVWIGYAGTGPTTSGVDHFVARPIVGYDFETVPGTAVLDIWAWSPTATRSGC